MLSFKRFLYIVLIVAVLGGIFLIYSVHESRPASAAIQSSPAPEPVFMEEEQVDEGEKPRVWILGDPGDGCCGEIYSNVRYFCEDIHLSVIREEYFDIGGTEDRDLVIFCDDSISPYADLEDLEEFIAGGGRVILAAGLSGEDEDSCLWPVFGIQKRSEGEDYHDLIFEKPLFPVQPERVYYGGNSGSARIEVDDDASVYIRDAVNGVPILHTYVWQEGSVCLINGNFLTDIRCMGLLSGAVGAVLPDFIYPVLGIKVVFLDNFPMATSADDALCRQIYGYSADGLIRDVVWPAFQGISLRTETPYTFSVLAAASSGEVFGEADDALFTAVGRSVLQFGGELVYAGDCRGNGEIVFRQDLFDRFSEVFPDYTVRGMVMKTDDFSPEMLDVPGADIRFVRGTLGSRNIQLSPRDEYTVFPEATAGNSMEDGNLFAVYSVLGAYGMISHEFDAGTLLVGEGDTAVWEFYKKQIGLFESEVLARVPWLEGRTLSRTGGDIKSYRDMDYGWTRNGNCMELYCSGAIKGQAFFFHTGGRIADAEGLTYQDAGNGYYLLRVQENRGIIMLEEEE